MTGPIDIKDIVRALTARIELLCAELFPRARFDRRYCQVGSVAGEPGQSLAVYLSGARQGRWADYATGEYGDALDLVAHTMFSGDKRQAVQWSLRWLGHAAAGPAPEPVRPAPRMRDRAADAGEAEKNRKCAHAIWLAGRADLTDTPVARYLAGRGIDLARLARPPRAIRFHPDLWHRRSGRYWPAMVAAIVGADGKFLAVHRTWLERRADGSVGKAPVANNKMVWPGYAGGFIRLARGASGRPFKEAPEGEDLWIAEGIEDALTAAQAAPELRVIAGVALANIGGLEVGRFKRLHLLLQNDTNAGTLRQRDRAIAALQRRGHEVWLHRPPATVKDINELQQQGVA
jgi:hypothetical protein